MDEAAVYTLKPRGKRKRVFRVTTYYQMAQETKPVLSIELFCTSVFVLVPQLNRFRGSQAVLGCSFSVYVSVD